MKKSIAFLILILPCVASAQSWAPEAAGVSGDLLVGVAYLGQRSHTSANDNSNPLISSVDAKASETTRVMPAVMGNVHYTFEGLKDQLYAGVSRSNAALGRFNGEFGYKHHYADTSALTLAYIPSLLPEEIWADPFVVGQKRAKTEQRLSAVRGKLERIGGTYFGVELGYGQLSINNERSGSTYTEEMQALLNRKGDYFYVGAEYFLPLSRTTFLTPGVYYINKRADGSALSYQGVGIELQLVKRMNAHTFVASVGVEQQDFERRDPIFELTQNGTKIKAFASYFYAQPFGWQHTAFSLITSVNQRDSNIEFYEQKGTVVATGLNYAF